MATKCAMRRGLFRFTSHFCPRFLPSVFELLLGAWKSGFWEMLPISCDGRNDHLWALGEYLYGWGGSIFGSKLIRFQMLKFDWVLAFLIFRELFEIRFLGVVQSAIVIYVYI